MAGADSFLVNDAVSGDASEQVPVVTMKYGVTERVVFLTAIFVIGMGMSLLALLKVGYILPGIVLCILLFAGTIYLVASLYRNGRFVIAANRNGFWYKLCSTAKYQFIPWRCVEKIHSTYIPPYIPMKNKKGTVLSHGGSDLQLFIYTKIRPGEISLNTPCNGQIGVVGERYVFRFSPSAGRFGVLAVPGLMRLFDDAAVSDGQVCVTE